MRVSRVLSLTQTLSPSTHYLPMEISVEMPYDGVIERALIFCPPGSEDLLELRLGFRNNEFLTDWIVSGDGKTISVPIGINAKEGDLIWLEAKNKDTTYSHTPTVEVIVKPRLVAEM